MSLVVEDGSGLPNAESYVSTSDCAAYASARGLTFTADAAGEQALRRATAWLDGTYRTRFPGQRKRFRQQALEWPRVGAADADGFPIAADEIPSEIVDATCEAAVRELASPGSMSPDLERGGAIKRLQAGSVEVEYMGGASTTTLFQSIDGLLASLIGKASPYTARAVRT